MNGMIAFFIIVGLVALLAAVFFARGRRRAWERARDEVITRIRKANADAVWEQRVADKMVQIKNQKPHPSDPEYRNTVPLINTGRTPYGEAASSYDPMTDLLSPLNPLSPLNQVYHSNPDPAPSHSHHDHSSSQSHDHSSSYSSPDPGPSHHDSGTSYGGDSYGGSSYDSGGSSYDSGGGGSDGGSSGGGDF